MMPDEGGVGNLAARRPARVSAGRLAVLVAALIVCVWFTLEIRALHDQARVTAFLTSHTTITATQARTANATSDDAQFLNADQSLTALRAIVETKAGDRRRAVAIAEALVRREPQNVRSWLLLAELMAKSDPTTYRLAMAHVAALAPARPAR
jgi:hypothetical protein